MVNRMLPVSILIDLNRRRTLELKGPMSNNLRRPKEILDQLSQRIAEPAR